ncbi:dienelactone hydrolase family protein [Stratiformator vulcanicus]|uniref:Dienelactone hydrolase family protein n=1 Tax=Stratiformator vulcanicus TaxID=2527980 RepID=A0A517R7C9_9PLAN|nr:dienelactone hydrolase family protein [Stratiformator vulcanicus]QDT39788.1 Dienelactone hydrolase family protein [Stratiformator vulcanicus]
MRPVVSIATATITVLGLIAISTEAPAEIVTKTIEYEHDGTPLKGFLTYDDTVEGPRPGVLVVHEWWGLNEYAKRRTEMLAKLGYAAFALDMYGEGKITEHPKQAGEWAGQVRQNVESWRSRALAGLEVLKSQPVVDPERLAAIGYCFGGATVLQLAYAGTDLKGVASFHGALPIASDADAEQVRADMLICHGAEDGFITAETIRGFRSALDEADKPYSFVEFAGARHSFTNPSADSHGIDGLKYDERADEQSWAFLKVFLSQKFSRDGKTSD